MPTSDHLADQAVTTASPLPGQRSAGRWHVRLHDSFTAVAQCWRLMQSTYPCSVFQTHEWLSTWYLHLGRRQQWLPCLVEVQDDMGNTVMLFALGVTRHKSLRVLGFMGGEVTDYHAPLVDPVFLQGLNKEDFNCLWQDIVMLLPPVDVVSFKRMPVRCGTTLNPMTWLDGMAPSEQAHAAMLPGSYTDFQQSRSAKLFADTRRQQRRLAELGEMVLTVQVSGPDKDDVIAAMARQKSRRWQESGSRDLFKEAGYLDFYRHLSNHGIDGGEVVVSGLQVQGQWIATHWGVRHGSCFYWLMPGYENGTWAKYSPGRVLLDAVVQWAIEEELSVFDLTVGDESYKRQWADRVLPLYAGSYGITLRGKIIVWQQHTYRAWRERAKEMAWLRKLVRYLRGDASSSR